MNKIHFNILKLYHFLIEMIITIFVFTGTLKAQIVRTVDSLDQNLLNYYNRDSKIDKVAGVSVYKAYSELLKDKKSKRKIVVAVIDGGVDINHEDLKGKLWINKKEIPGNGIDDDNNGYVDDINGWNFIGNSKGENINTENVEQVRIVREYNPIFKNIKSETEVETSKKEEYRMFVKAKQMLNEDRDEYLKRKKFLLETEKNVNEALEFFKKKTGMDKLNLKDIEAINDTTSSVVKRKALLLENYKKGYTPDVINSKINGINFQLDKSLNPDFDARKIIGDNTNDIKDNKYGNGNVKGPNPGHGTFVAGIIAANRNNGIGIDGIAENVEIMAIRVVPDGDERDKDVALGIRYAVDNGANIINMSFGKDLSPNKKFVDDAIKYAEEHNVLLVHAAGNNSDNVDITERYPTNRLADNTKIKSWINVGASAKDIDKKLCGMFSNYGKQNVDLFAPGVKVVSLVPENRYNVSNGTSFSCPVVSGVAALVWSYYPELTAIQLKEVLLESTTKFAGKKVYIPNKKRLYTEKVKFGKLSQTGGIVNAYNALKLAEQKLKIKNN
ncbi:MAG: S8 family peptidase [Bacteroidota bacterium]|nr:S8 family peptidase [Bacteroidota bacterium]